MDEIGDEFNDESGNDETEEELPELTNESDEPNELDDDIPETFSEPDEFDDDIPDVFSEPDEFDDDIPDVFSEPDEFDDDIPDVFSEPDEFDDDIPDVFSEPDEFDDDIPEVFSETDEFDDDILEDAIHDREDSERADEDQDSGDVENVIENENIGSQSTSTVLTSEIEEIESNMEHQEQEEEIEFRKEEYQEDTEPIVNTDEIEFIKDVEELAEHARETKAEDESVEPQAEKENAAYYAEQYYETLKEKEVVDDQDSKEEQETKELEQEAEELRQEVPEELKDDQESGYKSDELEEGYTEASKEITSTEEFEYLWEVRDRLDREGKPPEEIEEVMHEAEEMYETLKNAERIYEEQELEKLKLVDHEDEATEEDLKENLDRVDLVEQAVELEENLVQQGKSQEEIDKSVEESIETTEFEEKLESIIEQQEREKLKLVDHEDEATEEDLKEDLDRKDLVEQAVELEENLVQQGKAQEEIDTSVEESIETTEFEEKLETLIEQQESIVNKKLKKRDLEINEQNSNENIDKEEILEVLKPELDAIESESDEAEEEQLQELYRQETGRRPIYSRKKTNGYSQWLEQRELGAEKIKISKSEGEKIKEIKEKDWKSTLKQWIGEASEEECNAELKSELKKVLESYNKFEDLARKFMELYEKGQNEKLSEKEKYRLKSLTDKLHELNPIQFELLLSVFFIKKYITEQYWHDFWNKPLVNRVLSKFFKHISQKILKLKELINPLKKLGKHLNVDGSIDKKALAKELVYTMKKQRIENLRGLGYDGGIPLKDFVLHKKDIDNLLQNGILKDMNDLVSGKGKVQYGFTGFTYRIIDLKTKFFQTGLSFVPHPVRLGWYLYDIIFNPKKYQFRRTGTNQISGWIAKAIDLEYGLQSFRDEIIKGNNESLIKALNTLFEFEVTGVFWDQKLVRAAEDEQIAVTLINSNRKGINKLISSLGLGYNLDHPTSLDLKKITKIATKYGISEDMKGLGLNDPESSGKGGNPEKAEEFIWKCAYYTALGMPYSQMYENMKKIGLFKKSLGAFKGEYIKWFGSLEEGRKLFLNPIRESLKELHDYSEGDINRLYPLGKKFNKELFIHLAEENYQLNDIAQEMGWDSRHLGRLIIELIDIEYDFIEQYKFSSNKNQRTFEDLQYYLIAQRILQQAMINISKSEIMESFEGGITHDVFSEVSKRVLKAQRFNDIQDIARKALIGVLILDINPAKVRDFANDRRCWIPLSTISQKLAQFYKNNPLVQSIISRGHRLTNIQIGKVAVIGLQLESFYKLGFSNSRILSNLGSAYTLQDIIEITRLVWNTNPDGARRLLHTRFIGS